MFGIFGEKNIILSLPEIEPWTFHHTVTYGPMLGLINEIAGMWKEAGVASLRYHPNIYMERRKKRTRKDPGRTAGLQAKISAWELEKRAAEFLSTDSNWKLKNSFL